jgi:hypothetical protein
MLTLSCDPTFNFVPPYPLHAVPQVFQASIPTLFMLSFLSLICMILFAAMIYFAEGTDWKVPYRLTVHSYTPLMYTLSHIHTLSYTPLIYTPLIYTLSHTLLSYTLLSWKVPGGADEWTTYDCSLFDQTGHCRLVGSKQPNEPSIQIMTSICHLLHLHLDPNYQIPR